jgi:hypothetical protein
MEKELIGDIKEIITVTIYIFGVQLYRKTKVTSTLLSELNIEPTQEKPIGFIPGSGLINIP